MSGNTRAGGFSGRGRRRPQLIGGSNLRRILLCVRACEGEGGGGNVGGTQMFVPAATSTTSRVNVTCLTPLSEKHLSLKICKDLVSVSVELKDPELSPHLQVITVVCNKTPVLPKRINSYLLNPRRRK